MSLALMNSRIRKAIVPQMSSFQAGRMGLRLSSPAASWARR